MRSVRTTVQSVAAHHSGEKATVTSIHTTLKENGLTTDIKVGDTVKLASFEAEVAYINGDGKIDVRYEGRTIEYLPGHLATKVMKKPNPGQIVKFTKTGNRYLVNQYGNLQMFGSGGTLNYSEEWESVNPGGQSLYTVL